LKWKSSEQSVAFLEVLDHVGIGFEDFDKVGVVATSVLHFPHLHRVVLPMLTQHCI